ncbi:MAG: TOBE domain-containing protein, partial [Chloroflexota bacterium]
REPAVFLMDEPLSNLDAKLRVEARSFISKLHQRLETTFVYVTHDQVEAMTMGTRIAVLNAGDLQQLASPYDLYHNPANVFVGGFIGSPSMNFFDASLVQTDSGIAVDTGIFQIPIPTDVANVAKDYLGKRIVFGIRPEDIHDREFQPANINPVGVEANIDVIEQMGNEMIVYFEEQGKTFIGRLDPRTIARVGSRMGVAINIDNVHLFDADTEVSILYDYKAEKLAERK